MKLVEKLRVWWQVQTGEEETPFDGDSMAFVASLMFHMVLLLTLGLVPFMMHRQKPLQVVMPLEEEVEEEEEMEVELPEEFYFNEQPQEEIGANSINGVEMAESLAQIISDVSDVPTPEIVETNTISQIQINEAIQVATGLNYSENLAVKGAAGQGTTGAMGAIDRITHEILLSLQERKTLVVWLFDQSGSLDRQRRSIHERFDRIYEELGVIEAAGNPAFSRHSDKPLLTSVFAFGNEVKLMTAKPTDDLEVIKQAVSNIEPDTSGNEKVFQAVYTATDRFKSFRVPQPGQDEPERNVMIVAFTDERGDDLTGLDETVKLCRRFETPVYVVGVPAPFGREETMVKWVDPDPDYDQTPQWGQVNQGPESLMPERVKLHFGAGDEDKHPIDSGFGPFALTRLAVETGGIYFAVHPNRNVNRAVGRNEVDAFSAHLEHFFDPTIMRKYRPDYVTLNEYRRRLAANHARAALVTAARTSWITPMDGPKTKFVKRSEADLANALSDAQKVAASLEPKVMDLYGKLQKGEADRAKETKPRWQAGYDLAMGRVLAVKVRTQAYNLMLAAAKRGLKFENPENNTWELQPANDFSKVGSRLEKDAKKAQEYLQRVVDDHPGTPWALLAKRELERPLGWMWNESFTDLAPRNMGGGGNANPNPDPGRKMLKKPPKRKVPRL